MTVPPKKQEMSKLMEVNLNLVICKENFKCFFKLTSLLETFALNYRYNCTIDISSGQNIEYIYIYIYSLPAILEHLIYFMSFFLRTLFESTVLNTVYTTYMCYIYE